MSEPGSFRNNDNDTSTEAALSVDATKLEALVLSILAKEPSTTHEIAATLGLSLVSVSPRIAPLRRKGRVRDSGARREGPSGRKSVVWEIVSGMESEKAERKRNNPDGQA